MNVSKNASKQQKGTVWQYVAHFGEKNSFCSYLSPFTGLIKNNFLNKSYFSLVFAAFKHDQKNNLSEYFSARFRDTQFYV